MNSRSFKTAQGTELPLLNLRGKQYLEVKYRLVWFREEHPDWSIETELLNVTNDSGFARAAIRDEKGRVIATSHKFETVKGFPDFLEKAETGAIGRALALIGYGTQFCADELDEGARIVDSPVDRRPARPERATGPAKATTVASAPRDEDEDGAESEEDSAPVASEPGDFMINFGRKYKGKKLKEVPRGEIEGYIKWLENSDVRPGTALASQVEYLKNAFSRYVQQSRSATATAPANH